ncbi:MAG: MCE family protein [Thermoleophilaceae bacterium]|nr:MCE family protein [Thermoleophilaceae bacterium]
MIVDNRRFKVAVIIGFTLLCLAVFAFLYTQAGGRLRLSSPYNVQAQVRDPLNLVENSDVRIGGVKVGRVLTRGATEEGDGLVNFELEDESVAPIYKNATVAPRIKTLVGETYLDLDPGTPDAGEIPSGGTIPLAQAKEIVPLEDILSTLDEKTRADVQRNLRGLGESFGGDLGNGTGGHGDEINELFGQLRPTIADGGRVLQTLRAQRDDLGKAVDDVATVMQAFADRTTQVRTLAVQAKAAAEATAAEDQALAETFRELPSTLRQARTSLAKLRDLSSRRIPVLRDLRIATEDLRPAVRQLRPATADANKIFDELPGFIDEANPLLAQLTPFARALDPAIDSLDATLRQANPALAYLEDYDKEFGAFFANSGAINNYFDAVGSIGRVLPTVSPQEIDLLGNDPALLEAYNDLTKAGLFSQGSDPLEGNHYPKPGTAGEPSTKSNFKRLSAERP